MTKKDGQLTKEEKKAESKNENKPKPIPPPDLDTLDTFSSLSPLFSDSDDLFSCNDPIDPDPTLDLSLHVSDFELDLPDSDLSFLDTTIFEPDLLPEVDPFVNECAYCGNPAGWQHNTQHFIQLRSGDRYACFTCLRKRWEQRTLHHLPNNNDSKAATNHHRRLPRRRIIK